MCKILTPPLAPPHPPLPPHTPPPNGLLKSRFILFLPAAHKHSKFYQTGILHVNEIFIILLSYFKIITKKKLNSNDQN